ncbi:MAG: hypothetical protein ACRC5T_11220 [Cetobacterium sp.]
MKKYEIIKDGVVQSIVVLADDLLPEEVFVGQEYKEIDTINSIANNNKPELSLDKTIGE